MSSVQTLAVLLGNGTSVIIADQIAAIKDACQGPVTILGVGADRFGDLPRVRSPLNPAFSWAAGVEHALQTGIPFTQVMCLSSDTLLLRRGLDTWLAEKLALYGKAVIGVRDAISYRSEYEAYAGVLYEWGWPISLTEAPAENIADGFCFFDFEFALEMFEKGWLNPVGSELWGLPWGTYLSWLVYSLGHSLVHYGYTDKPSAPFYLNNSADFRWQPAPHILSPEFLVYHSARRVTGYPEESLRDWVRSQRARTGP